VNHEDVQRSAVLVVAGLNEAAYEANRARIAAHQDFCTDRFRFAVLRVRTLAQQVVRICDELLGGGKDDNGVG
jgi:hypothetical protein